MIELILLVIILSVYAFTAVTNPTNFLILYVLSTTRFLGFLDLEYISSTITGYAFFFFSINFIALFASFVEKGVIPLRQDRNSQKILFLFFIIFCHGVIYPWVNGYSNLMLSIISGKHLYFYFMLFYLHKKKNLLNKRKLEQLLKLIGFYLSGILVLYSISSISPPFYEQKIDQNFISNEMLEVYSLTYISLSVFIYLNNHFKRRITNSRLLLILTILLIGLFLGGHTSIFVTTIFGIFMSFLIIKFPSLLSRKNVLLLAPLCITIFFLLYSNLNEIIYSLTNNDNFSGAINSRAIYNVFRVDAINDNPLFGYGFIHSNAALMSAINIDVLNIYESELNVIDAGYIDLFIKFGYVGGILYLSLLIYYIRKLGSNNLISFHSRVVFILFMFQYFIVSITWSVLTYSFGITPLVISLFLLDGES